MKKKIKSLDFFFLFSSLTILIVVYYLEFFINLEPCKLCVYQRIPYFIIIFLTLINLILEKKKFRNFFNFLFIFIFLISLLLAIYHFGIENNFWEPLVGCESNNFSTTKNSNLKEYLLNKQFVDCKNVSMYFLNISLAGYNIIVSSFLLIISFIKLRKEY